MLIEGPAGNLEAALDDPGDASGYAVLCHPHPQFGGSMHDGVLAIAAQTFNRQGIACLRFNFRGVGQSDGAYDNGIGEKEDLKAAAQWLAAAHPGVMPWLLGYSFGAHVVWNSLAEMNSMPVTAAILVAPPIGRMKFAVLEPLPCPVFALAGDQDDFVDTGAFEAWDGVTTRFISGADHFFQGEAAALASELERVLEQVSA